MSTVSPCKGCNDRQVGCHGSCAAYLSWAKGRRETNRRMSADRKVYGDIEDMNYRIKSWTDP